MSVFTNEDGASWLAFMRSLAARGLSGVELFISDCHVGLKNAIESVFPAASWQRCRTHLMRNLLSYVPKNAQDMVARLVRSVFAQPDAAAVKQQYARVIAQLKAIKMDKAAVLLADCENDLLAFASFPKAHWKQICSNNPQERLNKEIRRRTDVVGIFPNRDAIIRLVGALLAEQHDERQICRRYMAFEQPTCLPIDTNVIAGQVEERKEV